MTVSPAPYQCPPLTHEILDEYEELVSANLTPRLRAWIREADKACRANTALLQEKSP